MKWCVKRSAERYGFSKCDKMSELVADLLETDNEIEETQDIGSFNHSYLQINLGALLKLDGQYTVCSDLSLDVSRLDLSSFRSKPGKR